MYPDKAKEAIRKNIYLGPKQNFAILNFTTLSAVSLFLLHIAVRVIPRKRPHPSEKSGLSEAIMPENNEMDGTDITKHNGAVA